MQDSTILATPLQRLSALAIDFVFIVVVAVPIPLLMKIISNRYPQYEELLSEVMRFYPIAVVIFILAIYISLTINRSQSIGKHLLDLQIISIEHGCRIGFFHYLLKRRIVGENLVIGMIPGLSILIYPYYFVIDSLFIFSKDHRTLHDRIANTKVIVLNESERRKSFIDIKKLPKTKYDFVA